MSDFRRIGEFARVRRGASPRPIDDPKWFGGENVGWVRISDVTRSKRFLRSTEQFLSPLGESKSVRVDKGDLIMSICATIGRPVIVDMAACIHDGFVQFYDIKDAETEYLYYALQHAEQQFINYGQTGTQANLNTTIVANHPLFLPKRPQQRRIAHILTTLDELIEKTEALIAKYQAVKQGMMHDLFTRGVDENGHLRPAYDEAPKLYRESELGWIPKAWEETSVGRELVGIDAGKSPNCPDKPAPVGEWGVLKVSAVQPDGFVSTENKIVTNPSLVDASFEVQDGDLLISRSNTYQLVGIVCLVRNPQPRLMLCDKTLRLRFSPNRASNEFMFWLLQQPLVRRQIEIHATGTSGSMKNISQPVIRSLRVSLPPREEQDSVVSRIHALYTAMNRERRIVRKLRRKKTGLMQDLLTGKVRVKVNQEDGHV